MWFIKAIHTKNNIYLTIIRSTPKHLFRYINIMSIIYLKQSGLFGSVAGNSAERRKALSLGRLGGPLSMYAKAPVTRLLEKLEWSLIGPVGFHCLVPKIKKVFFIAMLQ